MEVAIINTMFRKYSPVESARRIAAYGFKKVQLDLAFNDRTYTVEELTPELCEEVRAAYANEGIEIVAISGHQKLAFPDAKLREEAKNSFMNKLVLPTRFGCKVIVSETGSANPENAWIDHPNNYLPETWEAVVAAMKEICARARDLGVVFALEPHFGQVTKSPQTLRRMLDDVGAENLRIALDMANMVTADNAVDTRALIDEFFDLLGDEVELVHAKDTRINEEGKSVFLGSGKGALDYPYFIERLKASGYDGPVLLEYIDEAEIAEVLDFVGKLI